MDQKLPIKAPLDSLLMFPMVPGSTLQEVLSFNYKTKSMDVGEAVQGTYIPENCALAKVNAEAHRCDDFHMVATGGYFRGQALNAVNCIGFCEGEKNAQKYPIAFLQQSLT